jgi:hypothetical protein
MEAVCMRFKLLEHLLCQFDNFADTARLLDECREKLAETGV